MLAPIAKLVVAQGQGNCHVVLTRCVAADFMLRLGPRDDEGRNFQGASEKF